MNKKLKFLIAFLALVSLSFLSCSDAFEDNEFTIDNRSGGTLKINFRAEELTILDGGKLVLSELPTGTYSYITIFQAPQNVTVQTEGPVSGDISFNVGTKALLVFVSNVDEETYTLFASLTISDNLNGPGITDPLGGGSGGGGN